MIERLTVGPIGENAYILPLDGGAGFPKDGGSCILVDPGDEAERILAFLDSRALLPALVVATHGHLDHTAAIPAILAGAAARGAKPLLAVHPGDAAYFGARGEETNRRLFSAIRALGFFKSYWTRLPEPDLLLEDGALLPGSSWRVLHSPGHSAGSICLYDAGIGVLVSGDTLFRDGVGRTDNPDADAALLEASLSRKLFLLPPATTVLPGHGEPTTIGRERGQPLH